MTDRPGSIDLRSGVAVPGSAQRTPPDAIEQLVMSISGGLVSISDESATAELVCDGEAASRILLAADAAGTTLTWAGRVAGDWALPTIDAGLTISGSIEGDVVIGERGSIGGDLTIAAPVGRHVTIRGHVAGACSIGEGGSVGGSVDVYAGGSIGDELAVDDGGTVAAHLDVEGDVGGRVVIAGEVGDYVTVTGQVGGSLNLAASGSIGARLVLARGGRVAHITLSGLIDDECVLLPAAGPAIPLRSVVGARFGDEVFIGDHVRIDDCDFRRCADLDKLRLTGTDLFPDGETAIAVRPTNEFSVEMGPVSDADQAAIYRQLRSNLERRNDRPSAGRFYAGEMDARRRHARVRGGWVEWFVLSAYRVMSGYGLRAGRALGWFVLVSLAGTGAFLVGGLDLDPTSDSRAAASTIEALTFAVQSAVSFFRPPSGDLSVGEQWIQLGLRFSGPILLTQAVLAVRERVAR